MQGYEATLDEASFDNGREARQLFMQFVPGAVALVAASCIGVWVLSVAARACNRAADGRR